MAGHAATGGSDSCTLTKIREKSKIRQKKWELASRLVDKEP